VIKKADGWKYIMIQGQETVYIRPHEVLCTVPLKPEHMTAADWDEVGKQLK
jgi:predicted RNA binding protein YcfA (HicA-like mRNA interferase family)